MLWAIISDIILGNNSYKQDILLALARESRKMSCLYEIPEASEMRENHVHNWVMVELIYVFCPQRVRQTRGNNRRRANSISIIGKKLLTQLYHDLSNTSSTSPLLTRLHKSRSSRDELEFDLSNFV